MDFADGGIGLFEEALGAGNEGHLPNQVLLLSYLPISSSSVAKRFREHFAMLFLANFFGVESPRCDTLGLLSQLVALVGTTEIKKDTDYSHLACMVDLIDFTTSAMVRSLLFLFRQTTQTGIVFTPFLTSNPCSEEQS